MRTAGGAAWRKPGGTWMRTLKGQAVEGGSHLTALSVTTAPSQKVHKMDRRETRENKVSL